MNADFRYLAKQALVRAKADLAALQDERKYAALELRFPMEAVTYDRAQALKAEMPPEEYKTWQSRKLMQVLHDIDPSLGMSASIAVGVEETYGVEPPPDKLQFLGTDTVFTLADLKEHYDAIGNYLHVPSLAQFMKGGMPGGTKLRARCEKVIAALEVVLGSPIWNATFGVFTEFACGRCESPVRKRMPHGKSEVEVTCFECKAQDVLSPQGDQQVLATPKMVPMPCGNEGCSESISIWSDEVKPGVHWTCKGCGEHWVLGFGVKRVAKEDDEAAK
ncbi:hypothetical protein ACNJX9_09645 [Bradyrhizobium sp. DASA03076]|uniref:hypothetical protein n=1 Tax=Bradyrhizobium sp. BLXBL-03 TaxID=3395916 RepID=UPI003F6FEDE9